MLQLTSSDGLIGQRDRDTERSSEEERKRKRCNAGAKSHEVGAESKHKVNRRSYWREYHQVCANEGIGVCGYMWVSVCVCGCVWVRMYVCVYVGFRV